MQPAELGSCRLASCQADPHTRNQLSDKVGQRRLTITLSPRRWTGRHCRASSFPPRHGRGAPCFHALARETRTRANYCTPHLNHLWGQLTEDATGGGGIRPPSHVYRERCCCCCCYAPEELGVCSWGSDCQRGLSRTTNTVSIFVST